MTRAQVVQGLWCQVFFNSPQETLRKYSVVPVVVRQLAGNDVLCGHNLAAGTYVICHLQSVHHRWKQPLTWEPERFMPGGEYDQFEEGIRPYMVRVAFGNQ
jgi:cytochrome P450